MAYVPHHRIAGHTQRKCAGISKQSLAGKAVVDGIQLYLYCNVLCLFAMSPKTLQRSRMPTSVHNRNGEHTYERRKRNGDRRNDHLTPSQERAAHDREKSGFGWSVVELPCSTENLFVECRFFFVTANFRGGASCPALSYRMLH
jgi:hypothetical protein